MSNLLTMMEDATHHLFLPEEHHIPAYIWVSVAERCGFICEKHRKNGKLYYRLKRKDIYCERLYSRKEKTTFNYIDMADLHIGHSDCEEDRIKEALRYAESNKVDYVFIAGDLFDGTFDRDELNDAKDRFEQQIDKAFSIFKKFPNLKILAIPGNHEFSFMLKGFYYNPLYVLENKLNEEGCNFKAYPSYIQDFEIAGVIKRMMHLESYYHKENEYSLVHRLYEFNEHGGLIVKCEDNEKRPIRFLHCGHIHKKIEVYDSDFNVFITQPGAFIKEQNFRRPFIHVKGEVLDDLRIVRG